MTRLPIFPNTCDMWQELLAETRPIVIYGMGNGADKLISRLDSIGVEYADIFASDGFVRGQIFHGKRVKSYSEIKAEYEDFVVLLSFATRLPEVIELVEKIGSENKLYIPDMPVSEENVYFDAPFYNDHIEEIRTAFSALEDEESKNVFSSVIHYKLSGRITDLLECTSDKEEMYSLFKKEKIHSLIDVGAYSGDTLKEALAFFPNLSYAVCIEPDKRTFKRLSKFCETVDKCTLKLVNAAAWHEDSVGEFAVSGNRNSTVVGSSTLSYQHKTEITPLVRVGGISEGVVDYIKYDVEGSEREALSGSFDLISRDRPQLLISLYHKSRDIFELINLMKEKYPDYKFYLRRLRCLPAWELNLIMIPS